MSLKLCFILVSIVTTTSVQGRGHCSHLAMEDFPCHGESTRVSRRLQTVRDLAWVSVFRYCAFCGKNFGKIAKNPKEIRQENVPRYFKFSQENFKLTNFYLYLVVNA